MQRNNQLREPVVRDGSANEDPKGNVLHFIKIWHTFQGEGPLTGCPAVFIRLAGCNLQCPGCDTNYTVGRKVSSVENIVAEVRVFDPVPLVVLSGGEPFRQNIVPLILRLLSCGYRVQVETNGTCFPSYEQLTEDIACLNPDESFPDDEDFDPELWIVCSPKTRKLHGEAARMVDFWKYVVEHEHIDGEGFPTRVLGADMKVARPTNGNPIYLQPYDTTDPVRNKMNMSAAMDTCQRHGRFLSVQVHKVIGVE